MIIWIVLFLFITAVSFWLAMRSMRNYQQKPGHFKTQYALYLVQRPEQLTPELIEELYKAATPTRAIISFEKLAKGLRRAVVVYGPVSLLQPFVQPLGLIELEDYAENVPVEQQTVWEIGSKGTPGTLQLPDLRDEEEFWLQVALQPVSGSIEKHFAIAAQRAPDQKSSVRFSAIIRAVVSAAEGHRRQVLVEELTKSGHQAGLIKLPSDYTSAQLIKLYKERVVPGLGNAPHTLGAEELLLLVK